MKKQMTFLIIMAMVIGGFLCFCFNITNNNIAYASTEQSELMVEKVELQEENVLPEEYCLRDDYIIFTHDQDRNGLCWNFAGTMTATTTILKATNEYYDLSETWSAIANANLSSTMGGGNIWEYYSNITSKGLMLETDLQYADSYIISGENLTDFFSFHQKYSNVNLASTLQYADNISTVEDKKRHIYEKGALWLELTYGEESFEERGDNCYYKIPNQAAFLGGGHAVAIIGWDDNFEKEFYLNGSDTPTTFKGAWLILNSWGEDRVKDGISYVFYDDNNAKDITGFQYVKDTSKELYFYDKIESGYDYKTYVKGKYYGDFVAEENSTKQKNIFYDDVNLEYSYEISNGASIKSIDIYLDNINITNQFEITINPDTKRFTISKQNAEYGQHKVVVTYGNKTTTDTYLNNFIVTHGIVGTVKRYVPYFNENYGFNIGYEFEYYSFNSNKKNYVVYSNVKSGNISFLSQQKSIYAEKDVYLYSLNYNITEGNSCTTTSSITSKSGYVLNYNFNVEYYEDTTLQNVYVFYDLAGGINHSKNYHKELANETTDLMLYEPTREGYTFAGWYLDYGNGSKKLTEVNDLHYVDWNDIHHMGENPSLYAISHYKNYYNNSNTVFVYAHWEEIEYYDVNVSITGNGKVQPDKNVVISSEDVITYYFYPSAGYCLSEVKINGVPASREQLVKISKSGLTLKNVSQNTLIEATFEEGVLLVFNIGENIKNAYLKIVYNGVQAKFYNGDIIPIEYFPNQYYAQFDLIVEVFDDEGGYTYILEDYEYYQPLSKGVFIQAVYISATSVVKEIEIKDAIKTPIEKIEIVYEVNEYVLEHYLSTDINATSGTQSGSKFNIGEIVYLFIKKPLDTAEYKYTINEYYFEKVTDEWFRRTIYVSQNTANLYTISVYSSIQSYKITFKSWDGLEEDMGYWSYGSFPSSYMANTFMSRPEDEKYTYEFIGWSPSIELVVQDTTYTARFLAIPKKYEISINLTGNGVVNHSNLDNLITCEDCYTYIFTPDIGHRVKDVKVNGVSVGAVLSYTFENITSNQTITVEFERIKLNITIKKEKDGNVITENLSVDYGTNKTLTFTADSGYEITKVIVNGVNVGNVAQYTLTNITENQIVYVITEKIINEQKTYTITATSGSNGNISTSGTKTILEGEGFTYVFTPNAGYRVKDVKVNGVSVGAVFSYTFENVISNQTISVEFEKIQLNVIIQKEKDGNATTERLRVDYGTNKTLTFTADSGYEITKVIVNGVNVGNVAQYTLNNITENQIVYVITEKIINEQKTYTITATSGSNGNISTSGIKTIVEGESFTYTFTPNSGYKVKDVRVNGASIGAVFSYTFENVTSNQTISVEFEKITFVLNVICGNNGTVSQSGIIEVESGSGKTLTITPNENFAIEYIKINGQETTITQTLKIDNILENKIIEIAFKQVKFYIQANSSENGTITASGLVNIGENKRFDFYPNAGYRVKDVKIDNISIGPFDYYIFVNVECAHTISVEFEVEKFKIALFVDGKGAIYTQQSLTDIVYGENRTFTISAEDGWEVSNVYINGESINIIDNNLIISNIAEDINVYAIFKEKFVSTSETKDESNQSLIAIIIGASVISILLISLIVVANRNAKKNRNINTEQKTSNKLAIKNKPHAVSVSVAHKTPTKENPIKPSPSEPVLEQALNFVKGKQNHFISFCEKYKIDYQNNYNNAVIRYYQAYLRSIKK